MDIQTSKIELAKLILNIENKSVLEKIINVLKTEQSDFWNELSKDEKTEIKMGIEQLDSGKRTSVDDFLRRVS